ncbi:MAG: hypothetical protein ACKOTB_04030, partial [Planctomycetia bacterium]
MAAALFRPQFLLALCACTTFSIGTAPAVAADTSAPGQQTANPADAIVGDWRPADMPDADIRIFPAKGKYIGGVVKAANQALVNTEMLREIEYVPATRTWKGEVFALKRGMFVPMTIRLTNDGFEMVAGSGILTKTIEWKRVVAESS